MIAKAKRVLVLQAPIERSIFVNDLNHFPPMGPGHVVGYLRRVGVAVDQVDLSATLSYDYDWKNNHGRLSAFYDPEMVLGEIERGDQPVVQEVLDAALGGVDPAEYDMVCISAGADYSFFQINFAFVLGAYVQRRFGVPVVLGGNNIRFTWIFRDVFKPLLERALGKIWLVTHGPGEKVLEKALELLGVGTSSPTAPGRIHVADGRFASEEKGPASVIQPDFDGLDIDHYRHFVGASDAAVPIKSMGTSITNDELLYRFPLAFSGALSKFIGVQNRQQPEFVRRASIIPFVFNFNCPYNCTFCTESDPDAGKVVLGKVRPVVDSIIELKEKYGSKYFMFFNNYINLSKRFAREFAQTLIDEKVDIRWSDCARFNHLDEEMLSLLWESGCRKLTFGFETGSQTMSEYIDKGIDFASGEKVLEWCRKIGIYADLEVIAAMPYEGDQDFRDTCDFVERNRPNVNHFAPNTFFVAPDSLLGLFPERYGIEIVGSESYAEACRRNLDWFMAGMNWYERPNNFRLWRFKETRGRSAEEIEAHRLRCSDEMQKIWSSFTLDPLANYIPHHRLVAYTHGAVTPPKAAPESEAVAS